MYATVFAAEKLIGFKQAQLTREVERRRQVAPRTLRARTGAAVATSITARHGLPGLVALFGHFRIRAA